MEFRETWESGRKGWYMTPDGGKTRYYGVCEAVVLQYRKEQTVWYTLKTAGKILALRFYNFWIRSTLVYLGIVECCEAPRIVERISTPQYWEYECKNCGTTKRSVPFLNI